MLNGQEKIYLIMYDFNVKIVDVYVRKEIELNFKFVLIYVFYQRYFWFEY